MKDLSAQLSADGTLIWDIPPGEWIIQRIGMTPTGSRNAPASKEGTGLEIDKMNRNLAKYHFDQFIGEVLKRVPAEERKSFKRVVADSYETGSQNWTDGFGDTFRNVYGYDPKPWLPVLSGRLVGTADQSERFLWDLRRLVADRVGEDYVGGLRDACKPHGLELWLENYGHWGFPGEFLKYGGESDLIGGEYWVTGDLGSIECRAASSAANIYGKPFVSAEAFTGGPAFQNAPRELKSRGDWSFSEGINHFVLHVYIQQPAEDKLPGINAWFGTEFNRHNTWFEDSKSWVDYLRRSCWLLQQGHRAVDVAYFIGDDAPKMTGTRQPALPPGHDFDYINGEVILKRLTVKNGLLQIPDGPSYRVLILPELPTMRPEVLRKVSELVKAGATVLGPRPTRSPSLQNYPQCDEEVRQLAAELWGTGNLDQSGERKVGNGKIAWGRTLEQVFAEQNLAPDFQSDTPLHFTHRHSDGTDIYFVANPKSEAISTTASFRAGSRAPELWQPDTGRVERPAVYDIAGSVVRVPLVLEPNESVFVVFRDPAAEPGQRVVSVNSGERTVLSTKPRDSQSETLRDTANDFTVAVWVNPTVETTLGEETAQGASSIMNSPRNEVFPAAHGEAFGGSKPAGCGLAVGKNGVTVLEHGGGYFAPTLVLENSVKGWTHVTVSYRKGQPHLFLNGKLAKIGVQSEHNVHLPPDSTNGKFGGQVGALQRFGRALTDAEIETLAGSMPQPGALLTQAAVKLVQNSKGPLEAHVRQPGDYQIHFADGRSKALRAGNVPSAISLEGEWQVAFAPGSGAPAKTTFDSLADWTQRPEMEIKHFSGKATYRKPFVIPQNTLRDSRIAARLNLGDVRDWRWFG
ncbi:MAG: hypothetical protein HC767_09320 [Akkermansiaceae bacterium]|nr:hypothetical protein [Akkermansiaceae bacterium]